MPQRRMTTIFCYDVERDRTRARIARVLEERAVRVQRSVFEARLDPREADHLFDRLSRELDEDDSLRMYVLAAAGLSRSRAYGGAPIPEDNDFWLI